MSSPSSQRRPFIVAVHITRSENLDASYGFRGQPKQLPNSITLSDRKVKRGVKAAVKQALHPKPRFVIVASLKQDQFRIGRDVVFPRAAGVVLFLLGGFFFSISSGEGEPTFKWLVGALAALACALAGATFTRGVGDERYIHPSGWKTFSNGLKTVTIIVVLGVSVWTVGNAFTDMLANASEVRQSMGLSYFAPTAWMYISFILMGLAALGAFLRPQLRNKVVSWVSETFDVGRS